MTPMRARSRRPVRSRTSPLKTRARGFSQPPSGRSSRRGRRGRTIATGCRAYACKTPSGRVKWPNRDPIQERGGINMYGYSRNNPIDRYDAFGLEAGVWNQDDIVRCQMRCDDFCNGPGIPEPLECAKNCYLRCDINPFAPPSPLPPPPKVICPRPPSKPVITIAKEAAKLVRDWYREYRERKRIEKANREPKE
jgi:RHS repeat-associated protein